MRLYKFAKYILSPIFRLIYWTRVEGSENITKDGAVIVASNHISNLDPVFLGIASPRVLFFMAKQELFRVPVLRSLVKVLGGFPVRRGQRDSDAINKAVEILNEGKVLAIFPEGKRSKDGELMEGKIGAVKISHITGKDIVPVAIITKYKGPRPFSLTTIRIGEPIKSESFGIVLGERDEYKRATADLMNRIRELKESVR